MISPETPLPEPPSFDRASWPAGPWDAEPDRLDWVDETSGLDCMALRGPLGSWCGYVGVVPGHPWHGVGYHQCLVGCENDDCWDCGDARDHRPESLIDVHGGLTYSAACTGRICHVPGPGRPEDVWWFGFDCSHSGDIVPGLAALGIAAWDSIFGLPVAYRHLGYVEAECGRLAAQLAAVTS